MEVHHPQNLHEAVYLRSPPPIFIADGRGIYVDVNPAAERLLGAPRDQIIGRPISEFVAPIHLRGTENLWRKFRADGVQVGTSPIARPDGTDRLIRYEAVAEFLPGLQLSVACDITED